MYYSYWIHRIGGRPGKGAGEACPLTSELLQDRAALQQQGSPGSHTPEPGPRKSDTRATGSAAESGLGFCSAGPLPPLQKPHGSVCPEAGVGTGVCAVHGERTCQCIWVRGTRALRRPEARGRRRAGPRASRDVFVAVCTRSCLALATEDGSYYV